VGLANTAGTAKEFFDAMGRAVVLAGQTSEGEQQIICALDAGAKAEPARQKECLTKLTQAYPNDARAHNLMGAYYFGRQEWAASVGEFQKATELSPEFSQPYNQMGNVLLEAGRVDEAAAQYREQSRPSTRPTSPRR